jgi:hypothetical protein
MKMIVFYKRGKKMKKLGFGIAALLLASTVTIKRKQEWNRLQ